MSTLALPKSEYADQSIYETLPTTKGRLGMWIFLGSEVVTFGGIIVTYLLLRLCNPQWLEHSSHTLLWVGATNTVILLTSSLTVVLAHAAAEAGDVARTRRLLLITLLFGVAFLGFKAFEYHHEISAGYNPTVEIFWGFYFAMTGLHALHVIAGLVVMIYLMVIIADPARLSAVAPVGLYWHFVDIVWIFLFPLLYVTAQH